MRKNSIMLGLCCLALLAGSTPAGAQRYGSGDPLKGKLVLSIFAGGGIPVSDFRDSNIGNHEAGFDAALELEHYFTREFSLGLAVWGGVFDDRTFGSLVQTNIFNYGGFLKYTLRTGSDVYPYLKFGIAAAELEFEDVGVTFEVDTALGIMGGLGAMWRVSDQVSVNGQVTYNYANTEDKDVPALGPNVVVAFNTQYVGIYGGVSFYFY